MPGALTELAPADGARPAEPFGGADSPIRKVTRQVAFDGAWNAERAGKVAALFDSMAADWTAEHIDATKAAPIIDAVERGGVPMSRWLELGSGTGAGTQVVHDRVERLVAFDLSMEMLRHAPDDLAPRVRGDASTLPFIDDTFDVVMMINMLLFPSEVDRVLADGGSIVWINTLGDQTPIHLPATDVLEALPGEWTGTTAAAGTGFWLAAQRG